MSYFTRYLCSNFCLILKEYKYSVFMEEVFLCFFPHKLDLNIYGDSQQD